MKIVVLDGYTLNPGDLDWKGLEEFGECKIYDRTPIQDTQEIIRRIGDAQAVFTNKTPLPREVFETCGNIEFVGVLATGYNVVDIEAAKERNIPDFQYSYLWNCCSGTIRDRASAGDMPSYRLSQRGSAGRKMGPESGLVLLGLSSDRTGSKDNGNYRLWQNRAVYGKDRAGARNARGWHMIPTRTRNWYPIPAICRFG